VILRKHAIVSGSAILPGITVAEGTAIGALSLVRKSTEPWAVYGGNPATKLSVRKQIDRGVEAKLLATVV
jgi:acetyltransferase-like isoleucine patch superfamily enzyme